MTIERQEMGIMNIRLRVFLAGILTLVFGVSGAPAAAEGAVSGWRGDGSGHFSSAKPCLAWGGDPASNVLWKATAGRSYAGPVVTGDKVFVTAETNKLVCVSVQDGKVLWSRENGAESLPAELKGALKPDATPPTGGYATPTPVTDGTQVFVLFSSGVVACYDLDGKRKWVKVLPEAAAPGEGGHCASPVLAAGKLIVMFGHMIALDPANGSIVWELKEAAESYGTPAVAKIGGVPVLVTPAGDCVNAADGKLLASKLGFPMEFPSPVVHDNVVYFCDRATCAVRLPAKIGDPFDSKPLWVIDLDGAVYASGLYHDGLVYVADGSAAFYVIDAKDGKLIYKQALEIPTSEAVGLYGSIAMAGGSLMLGNTRGNFVVLAPGRTFQQLQRNDLENGEGCSPAFAGDRMFLRVGDDLVCIGMKAAAK